VCLLSGNTYQAGLRITQEILSRSKTSFQEFVAVHTGRPVISLFYTFDTDGSSGGAAPMSLSCVSSLRLIFFFFFAG